VSPVKYKLGFYIQEDDILHRPSRENLTSYTVVSSKLPMNLSERTVLTLKIKDLSCTFFRNVGTLMPDYTDYFHR
jgi:hypothetical protein